MTIWTEYDQIIKSIVTSISVNVINLNWNEAVVRINFRPFTPFTFTTS
nr:hypothetical protein [Spirosoma endbachense]